MLEARARSVGYRGTVIPLDLLFNALLGLGFAMCARDRLRADGPFAPPAFVLVATFVGVILLPTALYLYIAHPAWTWMYLIDPDRLPTAALIPLLVAHGVAVLVGWYVGHRLLRGSGMKPVLYALIGGGAVLLVGTLALSDRLLHYGSYRDYVGGHALALMDVKLGYVLVVLLLGTAAAATYVGLELYRDSRRVRAR